MTSAARTAWKKYTIFALCSAGLRMLKPVTTLVIAVAISATASAQSATPRLKSAQRDTIDLRHRVLITQDRPESAWPAVTVYLFVDATPEEATAVFLDYERHSSYIPSVKRSHVTRVISPTMAEVDYTVELPLVRNEHYTVRDHLVAESPDRFRVDWTLIRATSTKATVGYARFTPHANRRTGRTGTLFEYHNFVTPGSRLAGLGFIRAKAVRQVVETARAIAAKIETERQRQGALDRRIAALRAALAADASK